MSINIRRKDNIITYISSRPNSIQAEVVSNIVVGHVGEIIPDDVPVPLNADATSNMELLIG